MISKYKRSFNINGFNSLSIRSESSDLSFIDFVENGGKVFVDMQISQVPLRNVVVETPDKTMVLKEVKKTKLSNKLCNILGQTDNYFIVEDK